MNSTTDRIERQVVLNASRARVWAALTGSSEFSRWFGVLLKDKFEPGARIRGPVTVPGYEHCILDFVIESLEPEKAFSWRWWPNAVDPARDYSGEPMTLVTFGLRDVPEGTLLTVVESGFEAVPAGRREEAHSANTGGWEHQMRAIAEYLESNP
jgi:uncharacterized protein YndB with AHSA1/START domain